MPQRAAPTRRKRGELQQAEAQPQAGAESRTQAHVARRSRARAHVAMLTVAIRGPLAAKMRQLPETTGMSLAKLLGDMVLVCEGEVEAGYAPGGRAWRGGRSTRIAAGQRRVLGPCGPLPTACRSSGWGVLMDQVTSSTIVPIPGPPHFSR